MKKSKKSVADKLTLTVGISTKYGKEPLLSAAQSVLASKNVEKFRFIILADTIPLKEKLRNELESLDIEVIEKQGTSSLPNKLKEKLKLCKSDIILFTHDDIILEPDAISKILETFENDPKLTFLVARVIPIPAKSFFESVINASVNLVYRIGEMWNRKDNYLLANGRCMVFRTEHLKKFNIPDDVISIDVYFYLENKRLGGKFKYVKDAVIRIKSVDKLAEHMNQSSRFQYVPSEMEKYFGKSFNKEFLIPKSLIAKALIVELIKNPIYLTFYFGVFVYSRLRKKKEALTPLWTVDVSTKKAIN
jgi:cellulose synthase/poly-beta-1,6-N-acetylglucosamine synthase-like glycosyltransferase